MPIMIASWKIIGTNRPSMLSNKHTKDRKCHNCNHSSFSALIYFANTLTPILGYLDESDWGWYRSDDSIPPLAFQRAQQSHGSAYYQSYLHSSTRDHRSIINTSRIGFRITVVMKSVPYDVSKPMQDKPVKMASKSKALARVLANDRTRNYLSRITYQIPVEEIV